MAMGGGSPKAEPTLTQARDVEERIRALLAVKAQLPGAKSTLDAAPVPDFRALFREVAGRGKSFLEIGSGYGFGCLFLALLGAGEVHGIELLPAAVQAAEDAKRRLDRRLAVVFRQGDAVRGLPYDDRRFDVVLLLEVISHIVVADLSAFIRDVVRVLRPGGIVYISDGNNARSWKRRGDNYRIWERFDQGPPTKAGETVCGHVVKVPYMEVRKDLALQAVPSLSTAEAEAIAAR